MRKAGITIAACVCLAALFAAVGFIRSQKARQIASQQQAPQVSQSEPEAQKSADDCFKVIQSGTHSNGSYKSTLIEKVTGKADETIIKKVILKDSTGEKIGESESEINLETGKANFFKFDFDFEIPADAVKEETAQIVERSDRGTNDAVELVSYDRDGDDLRLTLRQTADGISPSSQFKILFYKSGEIVYDEECTISVYADGLNGVGSEEVVSLSVYDLDYDEIEYIYEP